MSCYVTLRYATLHYVGIRPSVCLSHRHAYRDSPGTACNAASVHFGPAISRTDIFICLTIDVATDSAPIISIVQKAFFLSTPPSIEKKTG